MNNFWVFAYGSLMWCPGFVWQEAKNAHLYGYHRSLCVYSYHHRGTPDQPGLVMGLKRGGSCRGVAFHIASENAKQTYEYLIQREQVTSIYLEKHLQIRLEDGRYIKALTFVTDCTHKQYAGILTSKEMIQITKIAHGKSGSNKDYILNSLKALHSLNIHDTILETISQSL